MLPAWTKDKKLDVVLCHLGTNDLAHEHDVSRGSVINRTIDDLEAIIDTIRRGNPGVSMYIAQIIPPACLVQRELFRAFNGNVAEIGPRKSRPSSPVYIVDHFTDFSVITDLKDGVHPSEAGAVKMATRWLRAMEEAGELGR
jgi:lysophospholipase L1-like esterase